MNALWHLQNKKKTSARSNAARKNDASWYIMGFIWAAKEYNVVSTWCKYVLINRFLGHIGSLFN